MDLNNNTFDEKNEADDAGSTSDIVDVASAVRREEEKRQQQRSLQAKTKELASLPEKTPNQSKIGREKKSSSSKSKQAIPREGYNLR